MSGSDASYRNLQRVTSHVLDHLSRNSAHGRCGRALLKSRIEIDRGGHDGPMIQGSHWSIFHVSATVARIWPNPCRQHTRLPLATWSDGGLSMPWAHILYP